MNILSKFSPMSLATIIAVTLSMSPTLSMADNGDRGHNKSQRSHDSGKSYKTRDKHRDKGAHKTQRNKRHIVRTYDKHSHKYSKDKHRYVMDKHYGKPHGKYNKHVNYRYDQHGHKHKHRHENYIVHHYDHYDVFDDIRFKIGIHTGNFDIVFRD